MLGLAAVYQWRAKGAAGAIAIAAIVALLCWLTAEEERVASSDLRRVAALFAFSGVAFAVGATWLNDENRLFDSFNGNTGLPEHGADGVVAVVIVLAGAALAETIRRAALGGARRTTRTSPPG